MAQCPSCARYVGPYQACPHCGARIPGRVPLHLVKLAAVLLATVGLAVLWYFATRADIPTVPIGQLDAGMNLAYIRLAGLCTRPPSYDPATGYLSFWLTDDTGELRVAAYRTSTRALIAEQRLPAQGDHIAVAGTVRIQDDFRTLTINDPDQMIISRPEPVERSIGSLTLQDQHQRIRIRGQVRDVRSPYPALTLFTLRDQTGVVYVALSENLMALSSVTPTLRLGQSIEVVAAVSRYGDAVQLVPASAADIVPLEVDLPIALARSIGDLRSDDIGGWFAVSGTVIAVTPFSAGVKMQLDDGTGRIAVLFWHDTYVALLNYLGDGPRPTPGTTVRVQGGLSEYRGELELMPGLPTDLAILAVPGPLPVVSIGSLTPGDLGRSVTVRGTIGTLERFSAGLKGSLRDESGSVTLLLWDDVYRSLVLGQDLVPGIEIEVSGEISEYRGHLEIVPRADGVRLVE